MLKFTKDKTQYGLLPLNKGSNSKVSHIFVNGFMSDEKEDYQASDWQKGLEKFINTSDKRFIYQWDSSFDYFKFENHIPFKNGFKNELKKIKHFVGSSLTISKLSPLIVSSRLNPLLVLPASFSSFCFEQWKISKENSIKYGKALAQEIAFENIRNDEIYLYAHSLGVNLLRNTLLELEKQNIFVEKVFLFGGASCNKNKKEWTKISNLTKKGIYNFYTKNDDVLGYFYRIAELGSSPVGLVPISLEHNKLFNIDVSYAVKGHFEYKKNLKTIFEELKYSTNIY